MASEELGGESLASYSGTALAEPRNTKSKRRNVVINDSHPFDLEAYISQYTGRAAINRLRFIADECDQLAPQALQRAIQLIMQTRDASLYQRTVHDFNSRPSAADVIPYNSEWAEMTHAKNTSERERLETELKTYTSNMIKESIRMGHRELGDYYWSVGDYSQSLKHYNKSREFCTTNQHVLEYSLTSLQLLLEHCDYSHIATYIFKAEAAFAPPEGNKDSSKKPTVIHPAGSAAAAAAASAAANPDREKAQAKIDYANGIAFMAQGHYEKAAFAFSKLNRSLDDWFETVVAPADIAIYGTLCAIVSMTRSAVKVNYHENENFGYFLEQEPYARELLDAFMNSRFSVVLDLLDRNSSRHLLDIHLNRHVSGITNEIRERSVVLYFQPFATVQLEKMSSAFGMSVSEMEILAAHLIQDGRIKARIDSKNKVLVVKENDPRVALYRRAFKTARDTQKLTEKLLFRMRLMQADLIVKAPKRDNHPSQQQMPSQFGSETVP